MGFAGRFGAGLPAVNDDSLPLLQHTIAKMHPHQEGNGKEQRRGGEPRPLRLPMMGRLLDSSFGVTVKRGPQRQRDRGAP